ncbi:CBO0543 family protein [Bacillus sp. 2205SS5-2]|uniref:CBO0543 family protein n=1 Tax=Bacillus sp. 2205SS5-2 TaxID=3109031 RepID=UPI0030047946
MNQLVRFEQLVEKTVKLNTEIQQYLYQYSSFDVWEYWVNLLMLLLPIVLLYFLLDRKRIFEIGFYGFAIHALSIYVDIYGVKEGLWGYPFQISSRVASNFALDSAMIPVIFMLIYQYTYHKFRVYFLTCILGVFFFSFLLKPTLRFFDLFWMSDDMNYFKLVIAYGIVVVGATLVTFGFHKLSRVEENC